MMDLVEVLVTWSLPQCQALVGLENRLVSTAVIFSQYCNYSLKSCLSDELRRGLPFVVGAILSFRRYGGSRIRHTSIVSLRRSL